MPKFYLMKQLNLKICIATLLCCVCAFLTKAQIIDQTSFEGFSDEFEFVTSAWTAEGFTPGWGSGQGFDQGRVFVDNAHAADGSKSLRMRFPAGTSGPGASGAQLPLSFPSSNQKFISYWFRFSDNFDWGGSLEGGKLPGLAGGDNCSGGGTCTGYNGFTARLMWRPGGKAVLYLYHMDKPGDFGQDIDLRNSDGSNLFFQKGQWIHVAERVKINSVSGGNANADGEVEVWINGERALLRTGLRFRRNSDRVDNLYFSTFHGGGGPNWAPSVTCHIWYDDIRIGNTYNDVKMSGAPTPPPPGNGGLPVVNITASAHDGNVPQNTYDNNLGTRWSAQGPGQWITHELDDQYNVQSVDMAFYNGSQRSASFDIQLSNNGTSWNTLFSGSSSGNTNNFENFNFPDQDARYVRIVGYGNSVNDWNSITEIRVNGSIPPGGNTISVRARMTSGTSDQLRLRLNNRDVHTWTVTGSSYADYTTSISGSSNLKLFFEDNGTDIQVDYIRIGSTTYQAEDQSTNTSAWQNGSCGGSNSEMMYCRGFIDFGTIDAGTAGSNLATRAQDNPETRSLNSDDVMEALTEAEVPGTIYPNPATSFIRTNAKSNYAIMIFNTQGQLVLEKYDLAGLQTIDISSLRRGFYLVKKIEAGKTSGMKLLVQ